MGKVLVMGDRIQDFYVFGKSVRLCPEAPVPVFVPERSESREGGAALVAANLRAFGDNVDTWYGSYSEKTRFFVGNHLLLRVDNDNCAIDQHTIQHGRSPIHSSTIEDSVLKVDGPDFSKYHAVVICDYNKGPLYGFPDTLPSFVDTKRSELAPYRGCSAIFPNHSEWEGKDWSGFQHVIRKDGANGCYVDGEHVPVEAVEAFDVTGAGDCFLAAFVHTYLQGKSLRECAVAANELARESVKHIGGYIYGN